MIDRAIRSSLNRASLRHLLMYAASFIISVNIAFLFNENGYTVTLLSICFLWMMIANFLILIFDNHSSILWPRNIFLSFIKKILLPLAMRFYFSREIFNMIDGIISSIKKRGRDD